MWHATCVMRTIISFAALFLSVILLQLSTGGVGPLDAISGIALDFTTEQVGLLGSAHFVGFFIGCWWAPRLMGAVGHNRAFAAFTAAGAIGLLAHMLVIDPYAWALMRVASGACVAGCYTVIESWMNAKVTNATRGRSMGAYRVADIGASLAAQLMISVLEPASYVSYNILAILCCASLLPLMLTRVAAPAVPEAPRLRPGLAWRCSPLAAMAVIITALSGASFRMVGPVYGQQVGLDVDQIAFFLAAYVLGGAVAQLPAGWLSDRYDRRHVMMWLSLAAIAACGLTVATAGHSFDTTMLMAFLFGLTTFPIYSVAAAHAHDFAEPSQRVELSAALMFTFALGAIAAPYGASALIAGYGPSAMFVMVAAGHVLLILFGIARMRRRPTSTRRTRFIYTPRTSFLIGKLTGQARDKKD